MENQSVFGPGGWSYTSLPPSLPPSSTKAVLFATIKLFPFLLSQDPALFPLPPSLSASTAENDRNHPTTLKGQINSDAGSVQFQTPPPALTTPLLWPARPTRVRQRKRRRKKRSDGGSSEESPYVNQGQLQKMTQITSVRVS